MKNAENEDVSLSGGNGDAAPTESTLGTSGPGGTAPSRPRVLKMPQSALNSEWPPEAVRFGAQSIAYAEDARILAELENLPHTIPEPDCHSCNDTGSTPPSMQDPLGDACPDCTPPFPPRVDGEHITDDSWRTGRLSNSELAAKMAATETVPLEVSKPTGTVRGVGAFCTRCGQPCRGNLNVHHTCPACVKKETDALRACIGCGRIGFPEPCDACHRAALAFPDSVVAGKVKAFQWAQEAKAWDSGVQTPAGWTNAPDALPRPSGEPAPVGATTPAPLELPFIPWSKAKELTDSWAEKRKAERDDREKLLNEATKFEDLIAQESEALAKFLGDRLQPLSDLQTESALRAHINLQSAQTAAMLALVVNQHVRTAFLTNDASSFKTNFASMFSLAMKLSEVNPRLAALKEGRPDPALAVPPETP